MYTFRIEAYIGEMLISGDYSLQIYRRLSDALNSDLHSYIQLTSAIVTPVKHPQKAERVSSILLDRSKIVLIATLKEPDPPADFQQNQPVAPRDVEQMIFYTGSFALRADFHKRSELSLEDTFNQMTADFIPLNHVHIFPIEGGKPNVRDFACLGRGHIHAAYLTAHHDSI